MSPGAGALCLPHPFHPACLLPRPCPILTGSAQPITSPVAVSPLNSDHPKFQQTKFFLESDLLQYFDIRVAPPSLPALSRFLAALPLALRSTALISLPSSIFYKSSFRLTYTIIGCGSGSLVCSSLCRIPRAQNAQGWTSTPKLGIRENRGWRIS